MAITTLLDWRIDRRTEEQRTTRIALEKDLQTQFARKEVSVQEETQKKMRASIEGAFAPLPEDWWKPRRK